MQELLHPLPTMIVLPTLVNPIDLTREQCSQSAEWLGVAHGALAKLESTSTLKLAPWAGGILSQFGLEDWTGIPPSLKKFVRQWPGPALSISTQPIVASIAMKALLEMPPVDSGEAAESQMEVIFSLTANIGYALGCQSAEVHTGVCEAAKMSFRFEALTPPSDGFYKVRAHLRHFFVIGTDGAIMCARYPERFEIACELFGRTPPGCGEKSNSTAVSDASRIAMAISGLNADGLSSLIARDALTLLIDKPSKTGRYVT